MISAGPLLQKFAVLTRAPSVHADERDFCDGRLSLRDRAMASTCMTLALGYHASSLFLDQFFVSSVDLPLFTAAHAILLVAHLLWFSALRKTRVDVRRYLWCLQLSFICFMGVIFARTIERGATSDMILAATGLTVISAVMLLLCPYHKHMILGSTLAYVAIGIAVVWSTSASAAWGLRWLSVHAMVLAAFTCYQYISVFKARRLAAKEYRTLRHIAPRQVVRRATSSEASIETLFQPAMRPVACISCDWRDYQQFSRNQEPETVAQTLNDYYDLCERLISSVCPEGNYYTDWIADELFIVIFGRKGGATKKLTQQALAFATALIQAKPEFLRTHAMPLGIDVGIAIGGALVGMMGPVDHRKATALGEIPGLARRIQGLGKLLRRLVGEQDRVILHDYTLGWLKQDGRVRSFTVHERQHLRDLDSNVVHYIEPAPTMPSALQTPTPLMAAA